jgi:Tfp pilus assembly protein PilV
MIERRRKFRRAGLTFPELIIGMVITAIVLTALAAVTLAVTEQWTNNDGTETLQLQASQIATRVQHYVSSALYIVQVTPGSLSSPTTPAGVLLWSFQGSPYNANTEALAGELSYIYSDGAGTLWLYQPMAYSLMTNSEQTASAVALPFATISAAGWATSTFIKYNYVQGTVIGRNLQGVYFNADWVNSTTQRPLLEFTIALSRGTQSLTNQYDVAVLRAAAPQPK